MSCKKSNNLLFAKFFCMALILCAPFSAFALESVRFAIKELCQHIEGNLGGLLMVTAGVGGMISAALGNMKAMYTFIITGIGAFTASALLSLYFPEAYGICSGGAGGGAGAGARTKSKIEQHAEVSKIDEVSAINSFLNNGRRTAPSQQEFVSEESDADLF